MLELVKISFSASNVVLTVLLLLCIVYWTLVIVGALGLDLFDVDADADGGNGDVGRGVGDSLRGLGQTALRFCNVGEVPVMLFFSMAILVAWAAGVLAYPWIGGWSTTMQFLALIPFVVVGVLAAKVVTTPIAMFVRRYREQVSTEQTIELVGRRCRVVSGSVTTTLGQVDVDTEGAPLRLNARTTTEDETLHKGDEAVILAVDETGRVCRVRGF